MKRQLEVCDCAPSAKTWGHGQPVSVGFGTTNQPTKLVLGLRTCSKADVEVAHQGPRRSAIR